MRPSHLKNISKTNTSLLLRAHNPTTVTRNAGHFLVNIIHRLNTTAHTGFCHRHYVKSVTADCDAMLLVSATRLFGSTAMALGRGAGSL
jgi:hypothetical protein